MVPDCPLAENWFIQHSAATPPIALVEGQEAPLDRALDRAHEILKSARSPLIFGLSRSSTPGQQAALELADRLRATVDTTASICHGPSIMALQRVGESTCTLGEVRNRADLVIFWGCDPSITHPRHADRYSVFAKGRWIPEGRQDRTIVVLGNAAETSQWQLKSLQKGTQESPDLKIPILPKRDFEVLTLLRALLKGKFPLDAIAVKQLTGVDLNVLTDLVERMKNCRYGIIFFGLGLTDTSLEGPEVQRLAAGSGLGHLNVEQLLMLVSELNAYTRFHARRMRIQGDVSGADSVLCWQTGYPFSVNLSRGYPRYNPIEFSANELLEREEVDACLFVGTETLPSFSAVARNFLKTIPTIALDYPSTTTQIEATVRITTAVYGVHAEGTIYRMDEVPLPLRAHLKSPYPTDAEVLNRLVQMSNNCD